MPRKVFVAGEILTAADVNTNLMDQAVMSFAGSAARGSAIPSPTAGMVTFLSDVNRLERYTTSWGPVNTAFTAGTIITATNASWTIPTLGAPIVRVTAIGGGGGGQDRTSDPAVSGSAGGTTTFNAGSAGTVSASGGVAGGSGGKEGTDVWSAGNGGQAMFGGAVSSTENGGAGRVTVGYLNLSGITTASVTIGAGGAAGRGSSGSGGDGAVIVEYVAG